MTSVGELEGTFAWHDGIESPPDVPADALLVFPGFYMLSLEEAVVSTTRTPPNGAGIRDGFLYSQTGAGTSASWISPSSSVAPCGTSRSRRANTQSVRDGFGLLVTMAAAFKEGVFFVDSAG